MVNFREDVLEMVIGISQLKLMRDMAVQNFPTQLSRLHTPHPKCNFRCYS